MLKLEKQRNINNKYPQIAKTFLQQGGIRGLTLGLWPWGVIMYSGRGICFGFGNGVSYDYLTSVNTIILVKQLNELWLAVWVGRLKEHLRLRLL